MPSLVPFALQNASTMEVAKHLLRHRTGSKATLYQYIYGIHRFSLWTNTEPDQLIKACQDVDGDPKPKAVAQTSRMLDDFVANLQAENLAPGSISNHVKGVKSLFTCSGLKLELPYRLSKTSVCEDRAPTPEELGEILDIANLREKVIVTLLALGGFRIGTLAKLEYRHVKRDLEKGIVPVHVHVEAEITKGKYHDFDTFLGQEAVACLRDYLNIRRKGTPTRRGKRPETIHDNSPLIRDGQSCLAKTVTTGRIYSVIHNLYIKADKITRTASRADNPRARRYDLRAHSIRKFFCTQMMSLGVQSDYVNYMMGHTLSTYHDIRMKGIEHLRGIYAASGLSIRPKTKVSKIDALKEIIRAWGLNPEEILTRDALNRPNTTVIGQNELENQQLSQLTSALRQQMLKEFRENQPEKSINSRLGGNSPEETRTLVKGSRGPYAWPLHHRAPINHRNQVRSNNFSVASSEKPQKL